ncbi:carbohydrate ABC transporter permease [Streptomyces acidiscabies]|uniref:Sugar ABC transporter permease n=1 Tax=Streptomyces acidiscabies TaxID=42234 RepID=A0AAP6EFY7_9ACTN|nr:sugar ABC transporter permease [Streptomyces acidiscabies]MBP5935027.1 sugar ABC transporter permease [Streptomyces sp. LBUM 1476]MBZ3917188.1 sugar ABC transporter permease [Streptomyces acidiscabies]MDX2961428.1 sugar ABC transporter permease [Streptomyces acidiscabies]MDX3023216.1 sugar ABC transporter permease [Streptomyces acidiscabies]MDX3792150.1 sugar ABC transporter permease [Streptomyces acidiscabies]
MQVKAVERTVTPPPSVSPGPPRPRRWWRTRTAQGIGYATPTALFVAVFFVLPLVLVAQMSLSDWPLLAGDRGGNAPENYTDVTGGSLFWPAVRFTLLYTALVTVVLLGLALLLALLVQESRPGAGFFRTVYFLPGALGLTSASLLFWGLYSPNTGPLSRTLEKLGLVDDPVSFLGSPTAALWSTVFLVVWKFAGFYMLILLVGLQRIPHELYEAARMDGASRSQIFRSITLPLLRPSLALSLLLCVTGSLLAFDQFFVLTKGGPDNSTVTVVQLIYREAFQRLNLGTAAALSIIVLAALLLLNALQFRGLRREDS